MAFTSFDVPSEHCFRSRRFANSAKVMPAALSAGLKRGSEANQSLAKLGVGQGAILIVSFALQMLGDEPFVGMAEKLAWLDLGPEIVIVPMVENQILLAGGQPNGVEQKALLRGRKGFITNPGTAKFVAGQGRFRDTDAQGKAGAGKSAGTLGTGATAHRFAFLVQRNWRPSSQTWYFTGVLASLKSRAVLNFTACDAGRVCSLAI
jgi:hypothetical protein